MLSNGGEGEMDCNNWGSNTDDLLDGTIFRPLFQLVNGTRSHRVRHAGLLYQYHLQKTDCLAYS